MEEDLEEWMRWCKGELGRGEEVHRAMERLEIEREWEGVRVCLNGQVGGLEG